MLVGWYNGWGVVCGDAGDGLGIGNGLDMIGDELGDWEWIRDDWRKLERRDKP